MQTDKIVIRTYTPLSGNSPSSYTITVECGGYARTWQVDAKELAKWLKELVFSLERTAALE